MKNVFILFVAIISFQIGFSQSSKQEKKPNILFIAIDDLKPTIGAYDDNYAITPNMDKIAKNGTVFLNNHTQQAICAPARVSFLTGMRPDYTQVWDLKTQMRDVRPNILTIPQHFKNNGYQTIGLGKIFDPRSVDKGKDTPSWSVPFIKEWTFTYPKGYNAPEMGFYQDKKNLKRINELREEAKKKGIKNVGKYIRSRFKPPFESPDVPDESYVDGAIAVRSIQVLESMDTSKPFFLAVGFKRPHLPFTAPKKYWDLYDKSKIKLAGYQKKTSNSVEIAYHSSGELQSYKDPNIDYKVNDDNLLEIDAKLQRDLIHGYYAATSYIDAQIGKIIQKLKEKGLDKNTIIVLWGDHGWHLGDHSMWNKHSNFEQATRSPLIVYSPKINIANKVESPTEFVDVFPTLCDLADIETPSKLDGLSLKPFIEGEKNSSKLYAVSQYPRPGVMGYSFRTNNYRYTVWVKNKKSLQPIYKEDIIGEELYDYKLDPNETANKIDEKEYLKKKQNFQQLAAKYFKSQIGTEIVVKTKSKTKTPQNNKFAAKKAKTIVTYIDVKMKLRNAEFRFLEETLYNKYNSNSKKTKGKNLSKAEKKVIYKSTFLETKLKLLENFNDNQVKEIINLERTKQLELRNN